MPGGPFPLGGPVTKKDVVDREDFLSTLRLRLSHGHSIMLAGPRRTGKTSLAFEILRRCGEDGFYTAFVDTSKLADKRELAIALIDACLRNRTGMRKTTAILREGLQKIAGTAKLVVKLHDLEIGLGFPDNERDDNSLFNYALELPERLAQTDKKRMVVVFDEFQEALVCGGPGIYKIMRSCFQTQENVAYLFLGSKESLMKAIFSSQKQAFYRFATALPIPPIPDAAWIDYITTRYLESGIRTNRDPVEEIITLTGGHPQDTMFVCAETHYALLEAGQETLSLEFVRAGYDRALSILSPLFEQILLETRNKAQAYTVLKRLARNEYIYSGREPSVQIKRAVDFLLETGLIEKRDRGSYRFLEPMLRDYILKSSP